MVKLTSEKAKTIVNCLAKENDYICSDVFFEKYKEDLEKVGIKKGKSCSSCLSMAILKDIIDKKPKSITIENKDKVLQHYKLKKDFEKYIEKEENK